MTSMIAADAEATSSQKNVRDFEYTSTSPCSNSPVCNLHSLPSVYHALQDISLIPARPPTQSSPLWSGWLYKQSRGFRKGGISGKHWQKRMFQLFKVPTSIIEGLYPLPVLTMFYLFLSAVSFGFPRTKTRHMYGRWLCFAIQRLQIKDSRALSTKADPPRPFQTHSFCFQLG